MRFYLHFLKILPTERRSIDTLPDVEYNHNIRTTLLSLWKVPATCREYLEIKNPMTLCSGTLHTNDYPPNWMTLAEAIMTASINMRLYVKIVRFTANIAPKSFDILQHTIRNTVKLWRIVP